MPPFLSPSLGTPLLPKAETAIPKRRQSAAPRGNESCCADNDVGSNEPPREHADQLRLSDGLLGTCLR